MIRAIKNALRRRRLARAGVATEAQCPLERYGEGGGSWLACPADVRPDSVIYSFGTGRDLSFDLALIARHGARVHAFDPTPASVQWVHRQTLPPGLIFHEIGLANFDGSMEFHAPRKATSAHFTPVRRYKAGVDEVVSAPVRKLGTIMRELGHERVDLLKIDIEGGEYDVIADIVAGAMPIGQLLIEFHHNYATIPFQKTVEAVGALRRVGFRVVAISDRTYELSLIHRDHSAWKT